jgi:hypothetical protein
LFGGLKVVLGGAVKKLIFSAAIIAAVGFGPQAVNAANFSFIGSFVNDNDVQFFNFSLGAASTVTTIQTYSYAGGTNTAGAAISAGGFDPNLSLFDATGVLIGVNNDGTGIVPVDPTTGAAFDSFLNPLSLGPGNYLVALTQSDNLAFGPFLANGFAQDGNPNFTSAEYGCPTGNFCDINVVNRTNQWALDILNVASADAAGATPLPAALPLFAGGLGALGLLGWRRKRKAAALA